MDLKVCLVAVCLFAFAVTYIQAGIPKCCVKTKLGISRATLNNVEGWKKQESNGACDIKAIVLYVRGREKPVCADPRLEPYLKLQRKKRQNKPISAV